MNETLKILTADLFADDPEINFRIKNDTERHRKGFGELEIVDAEGKEITNAEVSLELKKHEFKFGCNAFMYEEFDHAEQNAAYAETFKDLFNLAVVPFYWSDLEPEEGKVRFSKDSEKIYRRPAPDLLVEFCQKNNITSKGHPLMWHQLYPEWLPQEPRRLIDRIEQHIQEIAERYRDSIKNWDVINEVLSSWNPLTCQMPDDQLKVIFKMAEKYLTAGCTLNYNDGSNRAWEDFRADYSPLYMMAKQMLDQGIKLDCLGLQYHLFMDNAAEMVEKVYQYYYLNPKRLFAVMDQYAKLNIPFNVSEITIPGCDGVGGEELQAAIAERLYRIWFSHPSNTQIVWWNLVDGTAAFSAQGNAEGENRFKAGLVNYDFTPKPAFTAIKNLIKNEWTTKTTVKYNSDTVNKFHGFYGDYDVTIKTNQGEFQKSISMHKGALNKYKLELE